MSNHVDTDSGKLHLWFTFTAAKAWKNDALLYHLKEMAEDCGLRETRVEWTTRGCFERCFEISSNGRN